MRRVVFTNDVIDRKGLLFVHSFNSMQAMMAHVPSSKGNYEAWRREMRSDPYDLHGGTWWGGGIRGIKDIDRLVLFGWPEGERRVAEFEGKLNDNLIPVKLLRRKLQRADFGDALDYQSVLQGRLDTAWQRFPRSRTGGRGRGKFASIFIKFGAAHFTSHSKMFWPGAVGLVLAKRLMKMGVFVEISMADYTVEAANFASFGLQFMDGIHRAKAKSLLRQKHKLNCNVLAIVKLKEFHAPLNEKTVIMSAHAGLFRCYGFKVIADVPCPVLPNFGYDRILKSLEIRAFWKRRDSHCFIVDNDIDDEEKAVEAIKGFEDGLGGSES